MSQPIKRVRKAVLPAAGLGTRFLPATKAQPKEMLPVVDKPLKMCIRDSFSSLPRSVDAPAMATP